MLSGPAGSENATAEYALAEFGAAVDPAGAERWTGALAGVEDPCRPAENSLALSGKVALLRFGACYFQVAAIYM